MKRNTYDATAELGLPVTLLDSVTEDVEGTVEIPAMESLLASVAVARVLAPMQLAGEEIRFLRHVLGYTGSEFAAAIDLSDKTVVSRWETGRARPGGYTEKIVRQLVLNLLGARAPGVAIGGNAIPGMRIRTSGAALPLAFERRRRGGSMEWHVSVPGEMAGPGEAGADRGSQPARGRQSRRA